MLDRVATDRKLPKIIAFEAMATDDPTMTSLRRVLAARRSSAIELETTARPVLQSNLDGAAYLQKAMSASTRKKLRQHRRGLLKKGMINNVVETEPLALQDAFKDFLQLEASGWKGRSGTAMLCRESDTRFACQLVERLSAAGGVAIHALRLNEQPISMQIMLKAGSTAYTWKTAYDESLADYSPGILLFEDYTTALLADPAITLTNSCAHDESSYMAIWSERLPVVDILIDARRGGSLQFQVIGQAQRAYRSCRGVAKTMRLGLSWRK